MSLSYKEFQTIAVGLRPNGKAFIDGEFCDAVDRSTFVSSNPATGEILAEIAHCKAADVDRAVSAARRVFNEGTWSRAELRNAKKSFSMLLDWSANIRTSLLF